MSTAEKKLIELSHDIMQGENIDVLNENANLNGKSFSGKMSKLGSEYARWYAKRFIMPQDVTKAIDDNLIYVHDLDHYALGTTNCIFIPFHDLLAKGFNTGNGSIRTANSISSAMSLVAIIFQSQQNAQFGGVSANKLDYDLAPYVQKSFQKHFTTGSRYITEQQVQEANNLIPSMDNEEVKQLCPKTYQYAYEQTVKETYQAAESLVHNLNTMSSRAGGQIPFTSINYGTCTSSEGRLVIEAILQATMNGLGHGETPIFPIQIFKCKQHVNQEPQDTNYDLFLKAISCASKRLYPNFANLDAPFNLQHYDPDNPDSEFATMGCRTRVISDRFGQQDLSGKGNLSFNTINLVKLGMEHGICLGERKEADEVGFMNALQSSLELAFKGLMHRYHLQLSQKANASDFMMREGVWKNGDKLSPHDTVEDCLKHGSISIGFIGLAECMKAMYGKHHAEDEIIYQKALSIVKVMRKYCDEQSEAADVNLTLFATPAEGLSGKFTKKDAATFGFIEGITDRAYYTNSFHVPVYYDLPCYQKIQIEAPFHALCNAGAISYIELDGNARQNQTAFQSIIQYALQQHISYFSINHPIDRCIHCGYEGIIGETCPKCSRAETQEQPFHRLRRVTGYLTGSYTERFNTAKQAEVRERVKHSI
ncbi:anaerobic ribonucleoside triphosphate reductase [Longirhabdus pacifica]|uniref:anaerobic ribonucleoside triphosphate reductase n=1 Tax=Longirhabdus pacifica TaxID=2305227 RepID=UPI001008DD52|nr:anaerobic ribonucleoside triphosphate reductase [Longirhabdus pacifica]